MLWAYSDSSVGVRNTQSRRTIRTTKNLRDRLGGRLQVNPKANPKGTTEIEEVYQHPAAEAEGGGRVKVEVRVEVRVHVGGMGAENRAKVEAEPHAQLRTGADVKVGMDVEVEAKVKGHA